MDIMKLLPVMPAIMGVLNKHLGTIQDVTQHLPAVEAFYNEAHALVNKHADTIKWIEQATPAVQAFVQDAGPVVNEAGF